MGYCHLTPRQIEAAQGGTGICAILEHLSRVWEGKHACSTRMGSATLGALDEVHQGPTLDRHNGLFGPVDRTCSLVPLFRAWVGIIPNGAA